MIMFKESRNPFQRFLAEERTEKLQARTDSNRKEFHKLQVRRLASGEQADTKRRGADLHLLGDSGRGRQIARPPIRTRAVVAFQRGNHLERDPLGVRRARDHANLHLLQLLALPPNGVLVQVREGLLGQLASARVRLEGARKGLA